MIANAKFAKMRKGFSAFTRFPERQAGRVWMTSSAPMFRGVNQWNPFSPVAETGF